METSNEAVKGEFVAVLRVYVVKPFNRFLDSRSSTVMSKTCRSECDPPSALP